MRNLKKLAAFICSLSIMATVAGCGSKDDEKATGESNTESSTSEIAEESSEPAAEESVADESNSDIDSSSNSDSDDVVDNAESTALDTDGTMGSMNYKYSSDWTSTGSGDQITYAFSDNSAAIIVQRVDADSLGSGLSEDEMIEELADKSQDAWAAMEGLEVASSQWEESIIDGKKCYSVVYKYTIAGVETNNKSFFFANYTDSAKDLFAVTASDITGKSNVNDTVNEFFSAVSFN